MRDSTIDRRTVLKSVGVAGALTGPQVVRASVDERDTVRLVEAGVVFDVPDGHPYLRFTTDGRPTYGVDRDRVLLSALVDRSVRRTVLDNDVLVNADGVGAPPAATDAGATTSLPTALDSRHRTRAFVTLDEPVEPPRVEVSRRGDGFQVAGSGFTERLTPGTTIERRLDPRPVTVRTERVLDERVDNESVPPAERGLKTERGTVTVDAVPTVVARDYGELTVALLNGA